MILKSVSNQFSKVCSFRLLNSEIGNDLELTNLKEQNI